VNVAQSLCNLVLMTTLCMGCHYTSLGLPYGCHC